MNATAEKFGYPQSLLHRSGHWLVLLRPAQVTLGSLVLCCTDEARRFGEISQAAAGELKAVTAEIEAALHSAFRHDKINYLMLMMVDPDVHFHVFPRYASERELLGRRFADRVWPGPPDLSSALELPPAARDALFSLLRARFAAGAEDSAPGHRALVHAFFDAVSRGDRQALLSLFQPDLRWVVPKGAIEPYAGLHVGAEEISQRMIGAVGLAFQPGSQRVEIRQLLLDGEVAVAETRMTARSARGGPDYDNEYVFVFEFRGGKIAEVREHVDTRYAARFFGS